MLTLTLVSKRQQTKGEGKEARLLLLLLICWCMLSLLLCIFAFERKLISLQRCPTWNPATFSHQLCNGHKNDWVATLSQLLTLMEMHLFVVYQQFYWLSGHISILLMPECRTVDKLWKWQLCLTEKKSLFWLTNPTDRILNSQPQTFFKSPQKFLDTCISMCASDSYHSQYHTRVPNTSVSECTRAMHCPHVSWNLRELNSRILVSARNRTREHPQSNSPVLMSTRNHSRG